MPTLHLRFPGGRYHATPWGHHVNEGLVEWPPSPWRLLRALIACGFTTQGWKEIPPGARDLFHKFAAILPSYRLPEVSVAHSRHFMPVGKFKSGREDTTLVFDTWVNVGDSTLVVYWPSELSSEEATILVELVGSLGYLGRSESWVEGEVRFERAESLADFDAFPHQDRMHPGRNFEQVSLMAAVPSEHYRDWYQQHTSAALAQFPLPEGKRKPSARLLKDRARATEAYPEDLLACLVKDTAWWKQHRWSQPPGSQRVLYWRPSDPLQVAPPRVAIAPPARSVTTVLLSLTTPSGNRASLPPCERTLPQAELFHRSIVARAGRGAKVDCQVVTGRDLAGRPLEDNHRHAHTLPVDLDGDGHLDHIIVYAPMGLDSTAQRAIREIRQTWRKSGPDLQVAIVGRGELEILRQLPDKLKGNIEPILGPPEGTEVWESTTPFVPPRYLKPRGRNSLLGQINTELASRGLPEARHVEIIPKLTSDLRHYVRRRSRGAATPPMDVGFGLRLVLSEPVTGPILLGYASHYGLGMFRSRFV